MTALSVDRPVSEPMMEASIEDRLARHADRAPFTLFAGDLRRILARALPLPRRYTGGPLDDGLYLWWRNWWPTHATHSIGVVGGNVCYGREPPISDDDPGGTVWLIGPITIPDIPSEEATR